MDLTSTKKIIIIDDEEDILEFLELKFQQAGFNAVGFISIKSAEEFIFENEISAIVIDKDDIKKQDIENLKKDLKNFDYQIPIFYIDKDKNIDEIIRALSG